MVCMKVNRKIKMILINYFLGTNYETFEEMMHNIEDNDDLSYKYGSVKVLVNKCMEVIGEPIRVELDGKEYCINRFCNPSYYPCYHSIYPAGDYSGLGGIINIIDIEYLFGDEVSFDKMVFPKELADEEIAMKIRNLFSHERVLLNHPEYIDYIGGSKYYIGCSNKCSYLWGGICEYLPEPKKFF